MPQHVLVTSEKVKYFITDEEKLAIWNALEDNLKYITVQRDIVPLHITPSVIEFSRWFKQENQYLASKNKRLCRKCLDVIALGDQCGCRDRSQEEKIALPENIKKQLHSGIKEFPKLSKSDGRTAPSILA